MKFKKGNVVWNKKYFTVEAKKEAKRKQYRHWYHKHKNDPTFIIKSRTKHRKIHRKYRKRKLIIFKKKRTQLKFDVLSYYGGKCACCGETNFEFLTIDHINGRKISKHDRTSKYRGPSLYRLLQKENYPKGFQVLCFNCNFAKWAFGKCPHTA